ncbi:MAG: hypothetical protein A3H00_01275 [Candidatus Portnoybacteria bacterium RBG_13_40_8]|nr:MAG: hypothetical protein A3H00_01275 [Candidatus Portnoybacteria bacterium RBG_13_40_8]
MPSVKNPKIILVDPYISSIPGLGLAYLAAYLRKYLQIKDIKILKRNLFPLLGKAIIGEEPDLVGYFSLTVGLDYTHQLIEEVAEKRPSTIQIMGGPHITALPESLSPQAQVGIIGEGEETLVQLVRLFQSYGSLPTNELSKILGIAFYEQGHLIKTDNRPLIMDLDSLPKPARDLLDIKSYYPVRLRAFPTKVYRSSCLMTTRGCPYRCVFCQEGKYGPRFRYHSASRVVEEIEELIEQYNCNYVEIQDDQFLCHKQRLRDIVSGVKSKGLEKKAAFYCYLRATQVDEEVICLLKEMNTRLVFIGFESGSDKILKYLKDKTCSVEINQRAYDLCSQHDIYVYGAFIFGSPLETMDDMEKTYQFMKKNPMALCEVSRLTPLPGTGIWDYAFKKGLVNPMMDFENLRVRVRDDNLNQLWLAENVTKEKFLEFFNKKVKPLAWRYSQAANDFKIIDLFNIEFIKIFIKNPKFYFSVFKRSLENIFYRIFKGKD